jgi:hypothetical protein
MTISKNRTETAEDHLRMFVLDVLQHDEIEQLPSIIKLLNDRSTVGWREFWPRDFSADEVIFALTNLIREGAVRAFRERDDSGELEPVGLKQLEAASSYDLTWFGPTEAGRKLWSEWEPPAA